MKIVIVIALVLVLAALGSAGLFMLRRGGDTRQRDARMARALALRVGLSVAIFLFILLSWAMGWVHPTGLPTGR
jgi:cytochrome bd-type quinol oxidase subunit 2